ncbi:hypothetical protein DCAR_0101409 [Daucus carota subsp. sativus]|uniref:Uncharacterized protein n=1 Tax=Daucus carota subsp. sativus TaxID=79200 RepID=A0A162AGL9_DAUCS|nr:hypothetical protein DCAR_0101409 [Daucus carota subsp. sativus]
MPQEVRSIIQQIMILKKRCGNVSSTNDPGFAAQFMGEMGFQIVPQGQAQAEMEINDFILEDEIKDVSEDEAVVIVE